MRGRSQSEVTVDRWSRSDWWGVVLDAPDAVALAGFYGALFGWEVKADDPSFVTLDPGQGVAYLACQRAEDYVRPVWPAEPGRQQMSLHLDVQVDDLDVAVAQALDLGAEQAAYQPQHDVRVMLDPAGHPFCLYAHAEST